MGVLPSRQFDVPIICVGNLEAGGTGKSPLVMYIVELLRSNGSEVAVLSRGYGRDTSGFISADADSTVSEIGDEARQVKMRFPDVAVVVCEDRVTGVENLLHSPQIPDVIVMDDGFQHRWLKPALSILVTPCECPFWENHLLPVGTLREAKTEAGRADALVVSNGTQTGLQDHFKGPVFNTEVSVGDPILIHGAEVVPVDVVLLSGIGNPQRFRKIAEERFRVKAHFSYPDHHAFTQRDLAGLMENLDRFGAAANAVLTTEKDAMRLLGSPHLNELGNVAVLYLPLSVSLAGKESESFDRLILNYAGKDQ